MSDTAQPWDQRPGESAKAYEAFALYLELGASRSLAAVGQTLGKSKALMERWSSFHRWVERVAAYDVHLAELAEQARVEAVVDTEARWAERRLQAREDGWAIGQKLYDRAVEMLAFPLATVERTEQVCQSDDGCTTIIQQKIVKPAGWSFRDAAAIADLAMKLARLSVELETDRSLVLLEGLTQKDLDAMSLEQLQLLKLQIAGHR